jgi:hypothetical protein
MLKIRTRWQKAIPPLSVSIFLLNFIMVENCFAKDMNYKVEVRSDGGYSLEIEITKTNLFSADGFFRKIKNLYVIDLIGKGKDWSYRNQKGLYYSQDEILSKTTDWDFGYAWIDIERMYIYLNLYWVSGPDGMIPSDLNGKYKIMRD